MTNATDFPQKTLSFTTNLWRILILLIITITILSGLIGYQLGKNSRADLRLIPIETFPPQPILPEGTACTMEAKICPDGSAVGREGPNCEFAPCP